MRDGTAEEKPGISVIVPAYNEAETIRAVIDNVRDHLSGSAYRYEIIIVDDGSTDATGRIADQMADGDTILGVHHARNLGMGAAVRTGIQKARYPFLIDIPADRQFDAVHVESMLDRMMNREADIVVGYRKGVQYTRHRRIYRAINAFLLSILFGLKLKDPTWVKLFRRRVFDEINIEADGFFWETEVLIRAKQRGFVLEEIETDVQARMGGTSKAGSLRAALGVFFAMLVFWFRFRFR